MEKAIQILVVLATTRQQRASEAVATYLLNQANARDDIEATLYDVRDFVFNGDDEGPNLKEANMPWSEAVAVADGLLIVTPEYNHGYPGSLKLLLDSLVGAEYRHKAVAVAGVSMGGFAGARVVEHILPILRELGLVASKVPFYVGGAREAFTDSGDPVDEAMADRVPAFLDELVWLSRVLKWGRENIS